MEEKLATYYLIWDKVVGMIDEDGSFLFRDGEWVEDADRIILDHLYGFDETEPEESPYRMFNQSIMNEMKEISAEEAFDICGRQLYETLLKNGQELFRNNGKMYS